MELLEGLVELPGALFRKFFIVRNKSFDQVLKDHTKNKLAGVLVISFLLAALAIIIAINAWNPALIFKVPVSLRYAIFVLFIGKRCQWIF